MHKIFLPCFLIVVIFSCQPKEKSQSQNPDKNSKSHEYQLVWSDEFDYNGLPDSTKWTYDLGDACDKPQGCGWGNSELQFYTKSQSNVKVENGLLGITAKKEKRNKSDYTSARIKTMGLGEWKYGRISIRAKLPKGIGTWPAIWMLPTSDLYGGWPKSGEIDIMEHVGYDSLTIHGTVHTESYNHLKGTQKTGTIQVPDAEKDFHVYTIEWDQDHIDWFVDDQKYFTFTKAEGDTSDEWPFDQTFHLILNIAVGGGWGGQQGVDDSIWPQEMLIDYVRVEQKN